jgi:hypothetical protein
MSVNHSNSIDIPLEPIIKCCANLFTIDCRANENCGQNKNKNISYVFFRKKHRIASSPPVCAAPQSAQAMQITGISDYNLHELLVKFKYFEDSNILKESYRLFFPFHNHLHYTVKKKSTSQCEEIIR